MAISQVGASGMALTGSATPGVTGAGKTKDQLGKMDFMQMLVTQLRYQDPLKPVDDREFAAQLAQFSALEQMTELNRWTKIGYGLGLLGQQVTYIGADGAHGSGLVTAMKVKDGQPVLSVDGTEIGIDQVIEAARP